jgi:protein arginine kinase activator
MRCEKCKKAQASVFLTQLVEGKMQKIDLCENCSRELGVTNNEGFSLQDLMSKSVTLASDPVRVVSESGAACSGCGCTLADVRKNGRLGCATCYTVFKDFLKDTLDQVQKGTHHTGKVPASGASAQAQAGEGDSPQRRSLVEALERAVNSEDYEQAARLRDQLRILGANV